MISSQDLRRTEYWLNHFRQIHDAAVPTVLHSHEIDGNGAPQWAPGFRTFLTGDGNLQPWQHDSDARRLKRALKKIRQQSLRESEVLHRILELNQPVEQITAWLNERAIRNGYPERYTDAATTVIIFAAVDKLQEWY